MKCCWLGEEAGERSTRSRQVRGRGAPARELLRPLRRLSGMLPLSEPPSRSLCNNKKNLYPTSHTGESLRKFAGQSEHRLEGGGL